MNEAKTAATEPTRGLEADGARLAVMVIDVGGIVVAGNPGARNLCGQDESFVGRALTAFFSHGNLVAEPESLDTQWRTLRREALDQWTPRRLLGWSGAGAVVQVRLERMVGGAGSYMATLLLEGSPRTDRGDFS